MPSAITIILLVAAAIVGAHSWVATICLLVAALVFETAVTWAAAGQ